MGPELLGNLLVVAAARDDVSKMLVESLRKWRRKERCRSFCAVTPACAAWSRPASATKLSCSRLSATDNSTQHTQPVSVTLKLFVAGTPPIGHLFTSRRLLNK